MLSCAILSFAEDQYTTHSEAHITEHSRDMFIRFVGRMTLGDKESAVRIRDNSHYGDARPSESECLSFCDVQELSSGDLEGAVFLGAEICCGFFHLEE